MPEGKEIGKAYVTVHLDDQTEADYAKIRAEGEGQKPVEIPTKYQQPKWEPSRDPLEPVEVPTEAKNPIDTAWRAKVEASLKSLATDALKIPMTPDTVKYRQELEVALAEIQGSTSQKLGASLADRDKFRVAVEELVREVQAEVKARIPVEVDQDTANKALADLLKIEDAGGSAGHSISGVAVAWSTLAAVVAAPVVGLSVAALGAGFAALGVLAEKSQPQVVQAFTTMKTTGVDVFKDSFQSMTPVIVSGLNQWTTSLGKLAPQLRGISAEVAPALGVVNDGFLRGAQIAIPAMSQALAQSVPLAHAVSQGMIDMASGFARFISIMDWGQVTAGLAALGHDVGLVEESFGHLVNAIAPVGNALLTSAIPAALHFVSALSDGVAPALRLVGSALSALAPLLNFMSGPTAAVLIGVAAFKSLEVATNALLPAFNAAAGVVSTYGSKIIEMAGGSSNAVGSFSLMTDAAKKQAVQAAQSALVTAQQTAAQAAANLATVEAAAAAEGATITEAQLSAARAAATAATEAETEAQAALATATRATSFALGPVGIALGLAAGAVALFAGDTAKATPATQNFTQALNQLAGAAPAAREGIIAADPKLAEYINKTTAAGVSVDTMTQALNGNADAQQQAVAKIQGTIDAFGKQTVTVDGTTSSVTKSIKDWASADPKFDSTLDPQVQRAVKQFRDLQSTLSGVKDSFAQVASSQAAGAAAQAVRLTADQMSAASSIAQKLGWNVLDVDAAFEKLPGAGSSAAGSVQQVSNAFTQAVVGLKNGQQKVTDYFDQLAKSARDANNSLVQANQAYQQSIRSVEDAQHSYVQSQQAVTQAERGVENARRAVTDATHSYEQAQHSVAQAHQAVLDAEDGVIKSEQSLEKAQYDEQKAQDALTLARKNAAEQLKSLQLQLNDQVASEQRAQLKLFEQTQTAAHLGITPGNAQAILAQPTTLQNEALKQAALDLIDAQNAVADSLDRGAALRDKVNDANARGVDGDAQVVAAEEALKQSQEQVTNAAQALEKAHRSVNDALYAEQQAYWNLGKAQQAIMDAQQNVVRAQDAVRDAVYNEQRARLAVTDAVFNEREALYALGVASDNARKANDANTYSLDLNTQAGRNNYAQLEQLFSTYPSWFTPQQRFNQMVQDTSTMFHMSKDAALQYLQQIGQIPGDFRFSVTGVAGADFSELNRVYDDKFGGHIGPIGTNVAHAFAEGGYTGPGGKYEPAGIVHRGEWVIPQESVHAGTIPFLQALTKSGVRGGDGASLPGFAAGGYVGEELNYFLTGSGSAYQTAVNTLGVMGFPHPPGLPKYVPPAIPSISYSYGAGVAQWTDLVIQALTMLGQPLSLVPNVLRRMNQESGGNPNAVNMWDSNAAAGHPSQGLMQTIPSTFYAYAGPFAGRGILDPMANIYAGLNYAIHRYPSLQYAMDKPGGYDQGGFMLNKPGLNTTGKPEMVLPPKLTETLMSLHNLVQGGKSGAGVHITQHIATLDPVRAASEASSQLMWEFRTRG